MELWMIWVIIGVVCIIIEIFTPGFLFLSFGVSAILTGLFAMLTGNIPIQLAFFAVITFVLYLLLRKLSPRFLSEGEKSNIFALTGKEAIVTKAIKPDQKGYVKVGGEEWSAVCEENDELIIGSKVIIKAVEGNKLIVSKA